MPTFPYLQANIRLIAVHNLVALVQVISVLDLGGEWRANNMLVRELDSDRIIARDSRIVHDVARAILVVPALDLGL